VHVARMEQITNVDRHLVGKQEGKRPLGRPRRKWKNNIRMDLRKIWWKCVDWAHLAGNFLTQVCSLSVSQSVSEHVGHL
jgi:hypothetical protein